MDSELVREGDEEAVDRQDRPQQGDRTGRGRATMAAATGVDWGQNTSRFTRRKASIEKVTRHGTRQIQNSSLLALLISICARQARLRLSVRLSKYLYRPCHAARV